MTTVEDPSSMHEKAAVLERFRKARTKYLRIKYAYYQYSGILTVEPYLPLYHLTTRYGFITRGTNMELLITDNRPRGRERIRVHSCAWANRSIFNMTLTSYTKHNCWWFVDEPAPELPEKILRA